MTQLLDNEPENEISLMAFRLLTKDLLDLFAVMNEAVMNVLSVSWSLLVWFLQSR